MEKSLTSNQLGASYGHATSLNELRTSSLESPEIAAMMPKSIEIIMDSQSSGKKFFVRKIFHLLFSKT